MNIMIKTAGIKVSLAMTENPRTDLSNRIEVIESGYEFMLAYAAQGHESDSTSSASVEVRQYLSNMDLVLDDLSTIVSSVAKSQHPNESKRFQAFIDALDGDSCRAQGAIRLVLAQQGISSQLIDNLNASIHLRALLTDLFLVDEAFDS
jgi:hypothetical protein